MLGQSVEGIDFVGGGLRDDVGGGIEGRCGSEGARGRWMGVWWKGGRGGGRI